MEKALKEVILAIESGKKTKDRGEAFLNRLKDVLNKVKS